MPQDNPKLIQALKDDKAPLEYLVDSVEEGDAWVHKGGADKYGIRNWRIDKIKASTYKGAMRRHLKAWFAGEDDDPDSGWSHLYHVRACCAILLDSQMNNTLIDDRTRCESINDKNEAGAFGAVMKIGKFDHCPDSTTFEDRVQSVQAEMETVTHVYDSPQGLCAPATEEDPYYIVQFRDDQGDCVVYVTYKGPFPDMFAAEEYAHFNPQNLAGLKTIHALNRP